MAHTKERKGLRNEERQEIAARGVRIPIGKASAKQMIEAGFYADKTDYIFKLFEDEGTYYFFIRPRRFGKSLLLDTIDQIAQGNKELFKACAICEKENFEWKRHPVIRLNFSELSSKKPDLLEEDLKKHFYRVAEAYNIKDKMPHPIGKDSIQSYFLDLINYLINAPDDRSYARQPIVLIDEYDSPLISCKKEQYEEMLAVLGSFFKTLKSHQKDCKFIFVTGVTKFHLSGLTSGANSAKDISLDDEYAAMLGYTEEDIDNLFFTSKKNNIQAVIENLKVACGKGADYTSTQLKEELKEYYNGYYFTRGAKQGVYNPDSILRFFYTKDFENFWFNSGNPTILLQQMKQNIHRFNMDWDRCNFPMDKVRFKLVHPSLHEMPLLPLMYQTGYLTMDLDPTHLQDKNNLAYYLKFPNQEVKSALKLILADFIAQAQQEAGKACSASILEALRKEAWVAFLNLIRSDCFAKAGYRFLDKTEKSFQGTLYVFLNGAFHATQDTNASAERDSAIGRLDIVMEDQYHGQSTVYILELKVDQPACNALKQIHSKDYSMQYGTCHKKALIGLTCDSKKRNITEAAIQVHQRHDQNDFKVRSSEIFTVTNDGYFETA